MRFRLITPFVCLVVLGSCQTPTCDCASSASVKIDFMQQPSNASVGAAIAPAITVAFAEIDGKIVATETAVITISITSGTGTSGAVLSGTRSVAAVKGVASFSDLKIDRAGPAYQLTASANGHALLLARSSSFNVTATP